MDLTTLAVAAIAASPAYIKIVADLLKEVKGESKAINKAIKAIVKSELTRTMLGACERNWTTVEETDNVNTLYIPYHELKWNGTLDNLKKQFDNLEVRNVKEDTE